MRSDPGALGVFADPAAAVSAVRALRAAGHRDVRTASPAPFPELVEAVGRPRSRLDSVTLSAAGIGTVAGFALCIGTSLAWPLMTGGKPIVSVPPFVIIAFELSVLVGACVNLIALTLMAMRARRRRWMPYDPRFSAEHIGVFAATQDAWGAEKVLREHGAEEVRRVP